MRQKKLYICLLVLVTAAIAGWAEEISYLPADAVGVKTVAAPVDDTMTMIEQSGFVPYKGHSGSDASNVFESGDDGTQYGDNEYTKVSLSLMHYKPAFKAVFEQNIKLAHPSLNLQQEEQKAKEGPSPHGMLLLARSVNRVAADDGEMLLVTDSIQCIQSQYPNFVGSCIIKISGTYNSTDAKLARRIHKETVARIKKSALLTE